MSGALAGYRPVARIAERAQVDPLEEGFADTEEHGPLRVTEQFHGFPDITWDDETYRGDAYPAYGWAAAVALSVLATPRLLVYMLMTFLAVLRQPDQGRSRRTST